MSLRRRDVLQWGAALPLILPGVMHASQPADLKALFVYEPTLPAALYRRLAAQAPGSLALLPMQGERVRFARACLAQGPDWLGGLIRPADLLILAGTAEEAGLRLREERLVSSGRGAPHLMFTMQRRGSRVML